VATLHEVVTRHGPRYLADFGAQLPEWQRRALVRLSACRTGAAGHVVHQCATCGGWQLIAASCGHRACAECGQSRALRWEAKQQERRLPVPYFMVTFTVPSEFRKLFMSEPKKLYALLLKEASETLLEIGADPKHLGALMGATAVLHTWSRDLGYHVHVHLIVPSGGLSYDPTGRPVWVSPKKPDYLLPSAVLATRMRNRMRAHFQGTEAPLAEFRKYVPLGAWEKTWNVNISEMGDGERAFRYLARYVQSTAIRNSRILGCTEKNVTYSWTDRRTQQGKKVTVSGEEFLRRFLRHMLPRGLMRVRHYGYLSAAAKSTWADVQQALGLAKPAAEAAAISGNSAISDEAPGVSQTSVETNSEPQSDSRPCCAKCRQAMRFREFRPASQSAVPADLNRADQQAGPPPKQYEWNRPGPLAITRRDNNTPRGPPPSPARDESERRAIPSPISC
jgi:Putative transposase/Transposase zinc-binding domain